MLTCERRRATNSAPQIFQQPCRLYRSRLQRSREGDGRCGKYVTRRPSSKGDWASNPICPSGTSRAVLRVVVEQQLVYSLGLRFSSQTPARIRAVLNKTKGVMRSSKNNTPSIVDTTGMTYVAIELAVAPNRFKM